MIVSRKLDSIKNKLDNVDLGITFRCGLFAIIRVVLILCMLANVSGLFLSSSDLFSILAFQNISFRNGIRVPNSMDPVLLGLI